MKYRVMKLIATYVIADQQGEVVKPGSQVFWNDPDNGQTSRHYLVSSIKVKKDGSILIKERDGSVLECFVDELS